MAMTAVSFIVPMYNSASYLEKNLKSIAQMVGQKRAEAEVLLVDDGSTDETRAIAYRYAKKYSFIQVIEAFHQGVSVARNLGVANATGKYLTFIDSDDEFAPNFVDVFETLIVKEPDLVFVDLETVDKDTLLENIDAKQKISLFKLINRGRGNTGIGSKFFKRSFLEQYNLKFDPEIAISEDALFNYQAIDRASSILLSPQKFYYVLESHTLPYYNPKILESEVRYRKKTATLFKTYFDKDTVGELLWTDNKIKLIGYIRLVDRYFGPQYNKNEITLGEAAKCLRNIAENYAYTTSFKDKRHDNVLGLRYRVFRRLLAKRLYKTTLIFNKYMDKIKKTQRWK